MAEKLSPKEPIPERLLGLGRRVGNVVMVGAGVVGVLVPPLAPAAGAIIGVEIAQNAVSRRTSDYLKQNRAKKS